MICVAFGHVHGALVRNCTRNAVLGESHCKQTFRLSSSLWVIISKYIISVVLLISVYKINDNGLLRSVIAVSRHEL